MRWTNDLLLPPPHLPSRLTPEVIFTEMSSAEMPHGHGLLSSHSCRAPESSVVCKLGLLPSAAKRPWLSVTTQTKLMHLRMSITCRLPPFDGPMLDGQIGINSEGTGAGVEVTLCRSAPKREREVAVERRTEAAGRLDCSPITSHTVLHKRQKALMKTSGGFQVGSRHPENELFFPPLSLLTFPLGRIIQKSHLVEMSSRGAAGASSVTECCNASRAGAFATLATPESA